MTQRRRENFGQRRLRNRERRSREIDLRSRESASCLSTPYAHTLICNETVRCFECLRGRTAILQAKVSTTRVSFNELNSIDIGKLFLGQILSFGDIIVS